MTATVSTFSIPSWSSHIILCAASTVVALGDFDLGRRGHLYWEKVPLCLEKHPRVVQYVGKGNICSTHLFSLDWSDNVT